VPEVDVRQCGQLVDDRVRLRLRDGRDDGLAIQRIEDHRRGAQIPQLARLCFAAGRADDLVAMLLELPDQRPADRTTRSCQEDLHHVFFPRFVF
jgi:hypothetical protein